MKIVESAWYRDFLCQAGECPESCCMGRLIPLTEEDRERFNAEGGYLGRKLKFQMTLSGGEHFNASTRRCAFLNRRGFCILQECKGEAFIPEACRNFPRFYRNYRAFEERYIDLSCVYGAKLFLRSENPLGLTASEGSAESIAFGTNDDMIFLEELKTLRGEMLRGLGSVKTYRELSDLLGGFFQYCEKAQEAFALGQTDFFAGHPFAASKAEEQKDGESDQKAGKFPLPSANFKAVMETSFYHFRLRTRSPRLYGLCRLYFENCAKLMEVQERWEELFESFFHRHPQRVKYYADVYGYYLLQYFLEGYEDYSFRRHAGLGLIHVNMILLFEILYEKEYGEPDEDARAGILSAYVRRAYYNSDILKEIYAAGLDS